MCIPDSGSIRISKVEDVTDHFQKDRAYHEEIAGEYDAVVVNPREINNFFIFRRVLPHIGKGKRMIDLGCGTGHMPLRLHNKFKEILAVDHSAAMIEQADRKTRNKGVDNIEFVQANVLDYVSQYQGEKADLVSCIGFLHHLIPTQLPRLFRSLAAILSPGGKLLISEPIKINAGQVPHKILKWNEKSVAPELQYRASDIEDPDEEQLDKENLVYLLERTGFRLLQTQRNWEIFPRRLPPGIMDWLNIYRLNVRYGRNGNVFTVLAVN